jgi:hypothetical protein
VLIPKKITEPTGSDLVFKKCPFSFGQENYKPNCRLCRGLGAGCQKKLKNQFVVTLCFHLSAVLITNTISKPTCIHVQCSVLLSKKIAEPICSDFAFSFVIRADFQET